MASLQLAVLVIVAITTLMIWGTLTESHYGSEFARWHVYLSPIFLLTETLLFLNILFAALVRIPFKKRLTGFYITHLGLLLILLGAGITAVKGVDGSLELFPGRANRNVLINIPHFYGVFHDHQGEQARQIRQALPRVAKEIQGSSNLFQKLGDYEIFLERYIPFASPKILWRSNPQGHRETQVIWAELKNDQVQQTVTLTNLSQEESLQSLGPLSLGLLINISGECFQKAITDNSNKFLLQIEDQCVVIKDIPQKGFQGEGFTIRLAKSHPFKKITLDHKGQTHNFYPQLSVFPVNKQVRILKDSPINLMELTLWRKTPPSHFLQGQDLGLWKGKGLE